jgi:hypothetical protein
MTLSRWSPVHRQLHGNSASDRWWHAVGTHVLVAVAFGALCLAAATVCSVC